MSPLVELGILSPGECERLFKNIEPIRKLHEEFFAMQCNTTRDIDRQPDLVIFKGLLEQIPFFKIYVEYLNNFPFANDLLEELREHRP
jgi:hypothetical protein